MYSYVRKDDYVCSADSATIINLIMCYLFVQSLKSISMYFCWCYVCLMYIDFRGSNTSSIVTLFYSLQI